MNETSTEAPVTPGAEAVSSPAAEKPAKKEENFFVFLAKLVVLVLAFRSFVFAPFNIPSESMLPRLENGDYLLAAKWSYGYSRYSLPMSVPLIPGRILASQPERGDVVIFKAPPLNDTDYIKRVIGLPGDQVQMIGGVLHLNGQAVPKVRVSDAEIAVTTNTHCYMPVFEATKADGSRVCRYPRFRETLPGGRSYFVLDLGQTPQDDTPPILVPEGAMFMMGDNRDNSMDSRFPATPGGGIGIVPQANLVGKASVMMFSTDGSSSWVKPWTWLTATRWSRIGGTF
ncbi:signal peptidase I [Novosphingobium flavum]|uniref:Signal peptidase I n=1 Tax=Novosphingobium flavum TaxID=1778672 RepID=A0A7X1KKE8_9SPHN|nr:signal peptidase I [Novosphingobium flavum]MBC2664110.1 signal peptidase I [Novosphingobium flavum]